jgi:flagella basal body P-ring formation protein FlgA
MALALPAAEADSTGAGAMVPAEAVVSAIKGFVASAIPLTDAEVQVSLVGELKPGEVPAGELKVKVAQKARPTNLRRMLVLVEASNATGEKRNFWVLAEARIMARIVRALRPLKYGTSLTAGDLTEETAEIKDVRTRYCRNAAETTGLVLRRNVGIGDPLTWDDVAKPLLVRSGETVTLKAEGSGMLLSTSARAEQNGRLGDVIRVRNLGSARMVNARVIGNGEVRVN